MYGRQATSWFASFAPADDPRYAVVMMVSQAGTGAGTSGPSVKGIYEALFGVVDGVADPARSALAGGDVAVGLPTIGADGVPVPPAGVPAPPPSAADTSQAPSDSGTSAGPDPADVGADIGAGAGADAGAAAGAGGGGSP